MLGVQNNTTYLHIFTIPQTIVLSITSHDDSYHQWQQMHTLDRILCQPPTIATAHTLIVGWMESQ